MKEQMGFSPIELVVVVVIMGVLSTLGGSQYQKFQMKAKRSEAKGLLSGMYTCHIHGSCTWFIYMVHVHGSYTWLKKHSLYCIALYCFTLLCIALHCTALLYIALLCFALHCFALHCFTLLKLNESILRRDFNTAG